MLEKNAAFTKKKALTIVFIFAAALLVLIFLRYLFANAGSADLSTPEGRERFLNELGWEIDLATEAHQTVIIPDSLDGVMDEYNRMQLSQGYDLRGHAGETCEQYTYTLTNYPDESRTVLVTLYIQGRSIIAADIHTTAIDGFMHGIKREGSN